ncbi:MAG: aldehyde ferredoxin oxidoreductase N-terminal domain-containing protein [bacterium]
MTPRYGWVGRILRIDLTTSKVTEESTYRYAPRFIGGRAMAARVYWEEVGPEVGAYDPDNKLIIMTGPATGTLGPGVCRFAIAAKSPDPFPNCYFYSAPSGHFGPELKFAGYDGIIIQGKAAKPVYLWINDGKVEILDAHRLWGLTTRETDTEVGRLYGNRARALVIGPAGERLCREAVISCGLAAAAGEGGFGAVMGSKNLKAIVVRGTGSINVARPKDVIDLYNRYARMVTRKPGEPGPMNPRRAIQHFTQTRPITVPYIDDSAVGDEIAKGTAERRWGGCFGCPVSCIQVYRFSDGLSGGGQCNEVENVVEDEWLFYKGNKKMGKDCVEFGILCQELGLSVTQVIGHLYPRHKLHGATWARLLIDAALWTEENTGLPVDKMGSSEFFRAYLKKVAYREGIGDALAEGQTRYLRSLVDNARTDEERRKAKEIFEEVTQKNEPSYCVHWQNPPSGETADGPRWSWLISISTGVRRENQMETVVSSRSDIFPPERREEIARLRRELALELFGSERALDESTTEGKVPYAIYMQHRAMETDTLPICRYALPRNFSVHTPDLRCDPGYGAHLFSAVTGIDKTDEQIMEEVNERTFNLERAILVREGRRRDHDVAWNDYYFRLFSSWMDRGKLDAIMDEYYRVRGWHIDTGIPTREKLQQLGLGDVAEELAKRGIEV